MAKRRHSLNPAKVKRDAKALEQPSPPGAARRLHLHRRATSLLLGAMTVVLLNVSFAPWDWWFLAYVALVPWMMMLRLAPTRRWALLCAYLSGLAFWAASLYWLTWITPLGYSVGILYVSLYWLLAGAVLRAAMRRRWPMWLVLPLVWVALEYARAYVPPAFPWFYLAHTQYARTCLIQIADLTGQYGVSFFVAMVNGLVVDLCAGLLSAPAGERRKLRVLLVRGGTAVGAAAAILLLYGAWQLSRHTQSQGPAIGIVQQAFPISLAGRSATPEQVLDSHLVASRDFLGSDVDLVLWPETMLPRGLNRGLLRLEPASLSGESLRALAARFAGPDAWRKEYSDTFLRDKVLRPCLEGGELADGRPGLRQQAARVTNLARRLGCPILAGGATFHPNDRPLFPDDRWVVRNAAVWLDPNEQYWPSYAKRHLVPFSEYVPFKHGWTGLYKLLRKFVPDVMEQLDPGREWTRFVLKRPRGQWRLVSPICYEGTFARICRRMVYENGRKRADIIVNLSNDGWFVHRWGDGPYRGSTEHAQHLSHYCFRAVENRVPVVRAVNTGISASIDSNGRIVAEVRAPYGSRRAMIRGTLTLDGARGNDVEYQRGHGPRVLVDHRMSWYSRVGDVFAMVVALAAAAMTGRLWLASRRPGRKEGAKS